MMVSDDGIVFLHSFPAGAKTLSETTNQIAACTSVITSTCTHCTNTCIWMRAKPERSHASKPHLSQFRSRVQLCFLLLQVSSLSCVACFVFILSKITLCNSCGLVTAHNYLLQSKIWTSWVMTALWHGWAPSPQLCYCHWLHGADVFFWSFF